MTFLELELILKKAFPEENGFSVEMTKKDIESWDSIGHLNLILEIEDELDLSFSSEEIERIDSLKGLLEIVNGKVQVS